MKDKLRGGVKDFRKWTRRQVDEKFFADMRLLCQRTIPAAFATALTNCSSTGGNASFGAESRYNFVRRWGKHFFDADLSKSGTQSAARERTTSRSRRGRRSRSHHPGSGRIVLPGMVYVIKSAHTPSSLHAIV